MENQENEQIQVRSEKRRLTPVKIAVIAAISLLVLLLGTYFGCYLGAKSQAQAGDFAAADGLLFLPSVSRLHDARLVNYVQAGQMLSQGQYAQAKSAFEGLAGYLQANEMAMEADFLLAGQYADEKDFESALALMDQLQKAGYTGAREKASEFTFRYAEYLLTEKTAFSQALELFVRLESDGYAGAGDMAQKTQYLWAASLAAQKEYISAYEKLKAIPDYAEAAPLLSEMTEAIYQEGQRLYSQGNYFEAEKRFLRVSTYKDSAKYATLFNTRNYPVTAQTVNDLIAIFDFEDAAALLLSNQDLAQLFLQGTWKGDGYTMKMPKDGRIDLGQLPMFYYGGYYRIEDGKLLFYPRGSYNDTRAVFAFTAKTPDRIEVFCYANGETYTLDRQ